MRILITLLCVSFWAMPMSAADLKKEWVILKDCEYVDSKDNDGDSFHMRSGDKEFTARLYYVDAPETDLVYAERTREQSLYFGISLDDTMKAGVKAKERVYELLQKPFRVQTLWATAAGRGRTTRFYVLVEVNGKSLAEILVQEGLTRVHGVGHVLPSGEKSKDYVEKLTAMEQEAQQKHLGAWANSIPVQKEAK